MNDYRGKHSSSTNWTVSENSRYRPRHLYRKPKNRLLLIPIIILVLFLLLYPFVNPLFIQVDYKTLKTDSLPENTERLRVVYVSDLHYGYFFSENRLTSLIHQINTLNPDLVLFGGDYATNTQSAISFFNRLPSIHSRYGIFGVLGEADRAKENTDEKKDSAGSTKDKEIIRPLLDAMANHQVTPLVNQIKRIPIGKDSIWIAGLDEPISGKPDAEGLAPATSENDYVILLAHNPSSISEIQASTDQNDRIVWFDLALFGHTHGGQIAGLKEILNIAPNVESRYLSGWLNENRTDILVSNGVGTSVFPIRILCPAQIHCIDITKN